MARLLPCLGLLVALLAVAPANASSQDAAGTLSLKTVPSECITFDEIKQGTGPIDYRECRVSESGEFGTVGNQTYYAIYCLMPVETIDNGKCGDNSFSAGYHRNRAMAVFAGDSSSDTVRVMFKRTSQELGTVYYTKPEIIRSAAGTFLFLPAAVDGTSAGNLSEYFQNGAGGWERIETDSWYEDLLKRVPAGLEIWKGIWPDLRTMRAEAGLYRRDDSNCCPTGGVARIRFAITGRRFVLESVEIDQSAR